MISGFRKSLRSWAMILVLFLALVAIVVTGFGTGGSGGLGSLGGGGGGSGQQLATVNGEEVSESEVRDLITRAFAEARSRQPTLDMAGFIAAGGFDEILYQAIIKRAIMDYAAERGIVATRRMIDREILGIPVFRNLTGQFDENVYRSVLDRENISEPRFRSDVAHVLIRRQMIGPVGMAMPVPTGIAREYASIQLERRRGLIATIPASTLAQGIEPTAAELDQFYRANRRAFTLPERRVIKYAVIGPEQIRANVAPTEAEIAAVYRANAAVYGPRETRNLQSITFTGPQAQANAAAFAQRVRGGGDFAAAAAQAGFSIGDISFADQRREQFAGTTGPEVAAAAFAAAQGAVVGPIRSRLGVHVVRVDRITATPARPLEAVRADIARAIEQRKRTEALGALVSRIEEQLADGASFEEAARAAGLAVVTTPPVTARGRTVTGPPWTAPPELAPLLQAAFDMDPDDPEPVVEQLQADNRFALVGVDRVEPAAPPPLAQIRDRVRTAYIQRTAAQRARQLAERAAARINSGTPAARAFAESQPRISAGPVDMRRLEINRVGARAPAQLIALFSLPQGRARAVPMPNNAGWYVVVNEQQTPGDSARNPELVTDTRTEFTSTASEEVSRQFVRAIELRAQVVRDEAAISRARRQAAGAAAGD
jgi:peptidyl-prolyl cis-trans isomerase D